MNSTQHQEKRRVLWHSRRGMLELDLLLVPFATYRFETLSERLKNLYIDLLTHEDQDIFAWLLLREKPSEPALLEIVHLILAEKPDAD